MSLMSDKWIKEQAEQHGMIQPFFDKSIKTFEDGRKIPSYGLSTAGYDIRLGRNFTVFKSRQSDENIQWCLYKSHNIQSNVPIEEYKKNHIDILDFDPEATVEINDVDWIILPPHSFVLAHAEEYLNIPRDVSIVCMNKSTWARTGVMLNVTPGEPGWSGYLTLEISNTTNLPVKIWSGIGVVQLQFFKLDQEPMVSYSDRMGKYNHQPKMPVLATN